MYIKNKEVVIFAMLLESFLKGELICYTMGSITSQSKEEIELDQMSKENVEFLTPMYKKLLKEIKDKKLQFEDSFLKEMKGE